MLAVLSDESGPGNEGVQATVTLGTTEVAAPILRVA